MRPTPLLMPRRRPIPTPPPRPMQQHCACGAPAQEKVTFSDGSSRWYCRPCS